MVEEREVVDALVACGAVRFGSFTLASGAKSDYYVDIKKASTRADTLALLGRHIARHAKRYDRVAGMELGAVPLVVAAALAAEKPLLIVRKQAKAHGVEGRIIGDYAPGERVLVVEDVTTTGSSSVEAIRVLRTAGLVVDTCVTVVDRESGAEKAFEQENVVLVALARARDLMVAKGADGASREADR
ncbi:MAG TPA: orotate phosphoribosyltransferase [Candidatus Thermoplasmatota archaeon]|nr:orotate phosphoribosyltransferase [Candidatus Thermoplasmatota archaeon]